MCGHFKFNYVADRLQAVADRLQDDDHHRGRPHRHQAVAGRQQTDDHHRGHLHHRAVAGRAAARCRDRCRGPAPQGCRRGAANTARHYGMPLDLAHSWHRAPLSHPMPTTRKGWGGQFSADSPLKTGLDPSFSHPRNG